LNWVTGEVVLSSGGHPPALVQRRQGKIEEIFVPRGRLLGFSRGPLPLENRRLALASGETLCLYTDGITEALAPDGQAMFGAPRLISTLGSLAADQPVKEWAAQIKAAVDRFTGASQLHDDITLLLLRRPLR
jgi:phosphoserine phosphatase RsbU/P